MAGGLFALVVLGLILPDSLSWGFNFAEYLATIARAALLILTVGFIFLLSVTRTPRALADLWTNTVGRLPQWLGYTLASALLLSAFLLFRSRVYFYGDGLSIIASLSDPAAPPFTHQQLVQPLSSYGFYYLLRLSQWFGQSTPSLVMAVVNSVAGLFATFALWRIANVLDRDGRERWFRFTASVTSGAVILFFGYVEFYTIPIAVALWSLAFTLRYCKTGGGIAGALILGVIACGFHLLMLPFLLVGLFAAVHKGRESGPSADPLTRISVALILFGAPLISIAWHLTQTYPVFIPAFPGMAHSYWLLSPQHLNDLAQLILLIAPLGLMLYLLSLANSSSRVIQREHRILFLLTLMTVTMSIWIDPLIGMARDWDLLSICAFPLTLYGINRFLLSAPHSENYHAATAIVFVIGALLLIPQIAEKRNANTALERLDAVVWHDAHYQADYDRAYRCVSWGWLIQEQSEHPERSLKFFHRRIQADSSSANCWHYIGVYYRGVEEYDSAAFYFAGAIERDPSNVSYLSDLAILELRRNHLSNAQGAIEYALRIEPDNPLLLVIAGAIAQAANDLPRAVAYLEEAAQAAPDKAILLQRRLVDLYLKMNQVERAHAALTTLYRSNSSDRNVLEQLCVLELRMGENALATEHCRQLKRQFPDSPVVPQCERALSQ